MIKATLLLLVALQLAACGNTWRGARQDTGDNMHATGQAVEKGGEKVKP
jgi:predicted small secreted protein